MNIRDLRLEIKSDIERWHDNYSPEEVAEMILMQDGVHTAAYCIILEECVTSASWSCRVKEIILKASLADLACVDII